MQHRSLWHQLRYVERGIRAQLAAAISSSYSQVPQPLLGTLVSLNLLCHIVSYS